MISNSLLYILLEKLQKEEIRQLKKFIRSSFVTHRIDLGEMFNCLAKHIYEDKALPSKELLFEYTFKEAPFNGQKLRNTMSDLHALIEEYLKMRSMQKNEIGSLLALSTLYRQRNLPKHFQRTIRKVKNKQETKVFRNPDFYQDFLQYQIETALFQTTDQRAGNLNFQEIGDTMEFYIYLKSYVMLVLNYLIELFFKPIISLDYLKNGLMFWRTVLISKFRQLLYIIIVIDF